MRRKHRRKNERSPVWECPTCLTQMIGGARCLAHNPTPEEREQHPEIYRRDELAPHVRDRKARV